MKLPWMLRLIVLGLTGGGFALYIRYVSSHQFDLGSLADLALVFTLAALLVYVYYTYRLAKDAWTPSASFALVADEFDPFHFNFIIKSYSKQSLHCWCNLNAKVYNHPVSKKGFYNGETSFDVQPYAKARGHFHIQDLLSEAGHPVADMQKMFDPKKNKTQLYLDIQFWYTPIGSKEKVENPRQPHFFDFGRKMMVADF